MFYFKIDEKGRSIFTFLSDKKHNSIILSIDIMNKMPGRAFTPPAEKNISTTSGGLS